MGVRPSSAQRPCEGWKDPHVQLVSWSLQGSPELTALPRRDEAAAGEGDPGSRCSTARKANVCVRRINTFGRQAPRRSGGSVLTARHTCSSQDAQHQADHRGPGVVLHAAGQKARRAPRTEWGAWRTPPKSEAPEQPCPHRR